MSRAYEFCHAQSYLFWIWQHKLVKFVQILQMTKIRFEKLFLALLKEDIQVESDIHFLFVTYYIIYKIVRHLVHFHIFHIQYGAHVKIT